MNKKERKTGDASGADALERLSKLGNFFGFGGADDDDEDSFNPFDLNALYDETGDAAAKSKAKARMTEAKYEKKKKKINSSYTSGILICLIAAIVLTVCILPSAAGSGVYTALIVIADLCCLTMIVNSLRQRAKELAALKAAYLASKKPEEEKRLDENKE